MVRGTVPEVRPEEAAQTGGLMAVVPDALARSGRTTLGRMGKCERKGG